MGVVTRRSSMTFYSDGTDHYSHRVRIVLAEKGVSVDVIHGRPDDLADLNPFNSLPTLVDRDLTLYLDTMIMMEYLDERFPHPPLLPVYPVDRAKTRLFVRRAEFEWCPHVDTILSPKSKDTAVAKSRKEFRDHLLSFAMLMQDGRPFVMGPELSLADCVLTPILWRLPAMQIELPEKQCRHLLRYMERMFHRESFLVSLSDAERDMRNA
ncbi:MAG TPA: glutathione S-transferase N-terminal domain-containing protein [Moraxellaceae bacterium]|nr:glutathione S-transferase N-terminal domain-containing protein [Moraxellaceae bacterium]